MKTTTEIKSNKNATILSASTRINANKDTVWGILKNPANIAEFHPLIKESFMSSDLVYGNKAERVCKMLPMGEMKERISDWNEGDSYTTTVIGGKMLPPYKFMKGKIHIEADSPSGTIATFTFQYLLKYGVLGRMMNLLVVRPQFKKAPRKYVMGLKQHAEKLNSY